ncbi:NAD(P)-dependent oxidoreductase [Myxococcota bacterium]|nr:NAD(P)-dependent oxidoreductase [Myxococcota bacterium]
MRPPRPLRDLLQTESALVTGASGLIGAALTRLLVAEGLDVLGLSRGAPIPEGARAQHLDLSEPGALTALIETERPTLIFHLACPVDNRRDEALIPLFERALLRPHAELTAACLRFGTRLVLVGTCEEYGDGEAPFREDQPARPVSPYSAAKALATARTLHLCREGLRAAVARPFLTYGPGDRSARLVPTALAAALANAPFPMTDGAQTRELNHVEDIALGVARCAAPEAQGQLVNIGGGEELPVIELVRAVYRAAGADPALIQPGALPRRSGEVARFCGDHQKAQRLLHHRPQIPLPIGLAALVAGRPVQEPL